MRYRTKRCLVLAALFIAASLIIAPPQQWVNRPHSNIPGGQLVALAFLWVWLFLGFIALTATKAAGQSILREEKANGNNPDSSP